MTRINYKEILKQKRNTKFELLDEVKSNDYECNHSPGNDGCIACTHPNNCIFSKEHIEYEEKIVPLKQKQKDLQQYLINGEGTYGYDKNKIRLELYKIKEKLRKVKNL